MSWLDLLHALVKGKTSGEVVTEGGPRCWPDGGYERHLFKRPGEEPQPMCVRGCGAKNPYVRETAAVDA